MSYNTFKQKVSQQYGGLYRELFELFFTEAVNLANKGQIEKALIIGNDALVFAKYANIGYDVIYLLGMLCQAYLDNDQPESAEIYFNLGLEIIELGEDRGKYSDDIDAFLDLKILITESKEDIKRIQDGLFRIGNRENTFSIGEDECGSAEALKQKTFLGRSEGAFKRLSRGLEKEQAEEEAVVDELEKIFIFNEEDASIDVQCSIDPNLWLTYNGLEEASPSLQKSPITNGTNGMMMKGGWINR